MIQNFALPVLYAFIGLSLGIYLAFIVAKHFGFARGVLTFCLQLGFCSGALIFASFYSFHFFIEVVIEELVKLAGFLLAGRMFRSALLSTAMFGVLEVGTVKSFIVFVTPLSGVEAVLATVFCLLSVGFHVSTGLIYGIFRRWWPAGVSLAILLHITFNYPTYVGAENALNIIVFECLIVILTVVVALLARRYLGNASIGSAGGAIAR